ncbi:MAG: hypothetical protein MIO93_08270 [ANME-2 cluster archaeon]|nr:hypothetical protein [ANME-2 cluster archaeon]
MLETSEERVKLMKAGYSQKEIEEMYLTEHDFTKSLNTFLFEIVELDLTNKAPSRSVGGSMAPTIEVALTTLCPGRSRAAEYND